MQVFGTLLVPYFVAEIIDIGIAQKNTDLVIAAGIKMFFAALATVVITLSSSFLSADLAANITNKLRQKIFMKTQDFSITNFKTIGTASMITRTTSDVNTIGQTVIMFAQLVLPMPLILIASVIMTYLKAPTLVYIPIVTTLIFIVAVHIIFKKSTIISRILPGKIDAINRTVRESIVGIRVIRAFDNSEYEQTRSNDAFEDYARSVISLNKIFASFMPLVWCVMGLAMASIAWFGGYSVIKGDMPIGSIIAVSEYTILMLMYFMMASMVLALIPRMLTSIGRINEVMSITPEILDPENFITKNAITTDKKIEFNNVSFAYEGAEIPVLKNISFSCALGETTAIIGGTGSGKSTIGQLMLRFHDVKAGEILFEGVNIKNLSQEFLREKISYIPQKAFLFSGTIRENLTFGNKSASIDEIEKAAKVSQAETFINTLDKGYDSHVAQGGGNFSGGQKQRICIARGLLKKSLLYIFDDSFSALDFKTDAKLRQALKSEKRDSAKVIIAQRISTIMDADQIIVLDAGKIVGKGVHSELMKSCAVYQDIATSQLTEKEISEA